jgi:hypothetical protein
MPDISQATWSESDSANTATPPDGWPENQAPSTVNDCARMMMGALKRFWNRINPATAATGSPNAYVLTPAGALAAYVTGEVYAFRAGFANTGSATLNISALGAKAIKKYTAGGKVALTAGDIQNGQPLQVAYDGTDMVLLAAATAPKTGQTTRDLTTASGSQAITGVGFKPRYVHIIANVPANAMASIGMDDGATASCIFNDHNAAANIWNRSTALSVFLRATSTPAQQTASISSMDSDGFTLNWTKTGSPTGTANIFYTAYP